MLKIFEVFHLDISGKDFNDLQLKNICCVIFRLLVFHLDILGKTDSNEQS